MDVDVGGSELAGENAPTSECGLVAAVPCSFVDHSHHDAGQESASAEASTDTETRNGTAPEPETLNDDVPLSLASTTEPAALDDAEEQRREGKKPAKIASPLGMSPSHCSVCGMDTRFLWEHRRLRSLLHCTLPLTFGVVACRVVLVKVTTLAMR
jgi:hypothetical protein